MARLTLTHCCVLQIRALLGGCSFKRPTHQLIDQGTTQEQVAVAVHKRVRQLAHGTLRTFIVLVNCQTFGGGSNSDYKRSDQWELLHCVFLIMLLLQPSVGRSS
jgi:hypothetical protein